MAKAKMDDVREQRIQYEVVVDAYDADERYSGWFYYLEDKMVVPFAARCRVRLKCSPLLEGDQVTVTGLVWVDGTQDMFVEIEWEGRSFGVPLVQLEPLDADDASQEAVEDWHYWRERGYEF